MDKEIPRLTGSDHKKDRYDKPERELTPAGLARMSARIVFDDEARIKGKLRELKGEPKSFRDSPDERAAAVYGKSFEDKSIADDRAERFQDVNQYGSARAIKGNELYENAEAIMKDETIEQTTERKKKLEELKRICRELCQGLTMEEADNRVEDLHGTPTRRGYINSQVRAHDLVTDPLGRNKPHEKSKGNLN